MTNASRILVGIPTRDRSQYLACLLSSLLFQTDTDFDVLIVDTSTLPDDDLGGSSIVQRLVAALRATGHEVSIEKTTVVGRSEVVAVNHIILTAKLGGYGFVFKVDDDHVLPSDTLLRFRRVHVLCKGDADVLLSGVTPWMAEVFPGAASPEDAPRSAMDIPPRGVSFIRDVGGVGIDLEIGHFSRYTGSDYVRTELASAANFFFRPDTRILWSDIGESSKYADAIWFTQLREILNYRLYFLLGLNVWHVAAPAGGVRERFNDFEKLSPADLWRGEYLRQLHCELKAKTNED